MARLKLHFKHNNTTAQQHNMASRMGFSWGGSIGLNTTATESTTSSALVAKPKVTIASPVAITSTSNHQSISKKHNKRSLDDDMNQTFFTPTATTNKYSTSIKSSKKKYSYYNTHPQTTTTSTSNNSSLLTSQSLPLSRSLNLLSKEQLSELIQTMVQDQPELSIPLQNNINERLLDTITIQDFINDLEIKFNNIIKNIPYNKKYYDIEKINPQILNSQYRILDLDDYSFTRLKPYILDFLNCLIDYILFNLPPMIKNFIESIKLLDSITIICVNLPRFKLPSNNYYYDKCWEQISFIWCSLINQLYNDPILLNLNGNNDSILLNWFNKLQDYNQLTNGMLTQPWNLIKSLLLQGENNDQAKLLLLQQQQQQHQQQQQQQQQHQQLQHQQLQHQQQQQSMSSFSVTPNYNVNNFSFNNTSKGTSNNQSTLLQFKGLNNS